MGDLGYLNACYSIGDVPVAIPICPGVRGVAGKNEKRASCRGSSAQFFLGWDFEKFLCPDPNFFLFSFLCPQDVLLKANICTILKFMLLAHFYKVDGQIGPHFFQLAHFLKISGGVSLLFKISRCNTAE